MKDSVITGYNYCIAAGQTDVGRHRKANEDHGAHFVTKNGLVSVVCDGMGGHVGGAVASEIAVNTIRNFLDSQYYDDPKEAIGRAIDAANNAVMQRATVEPGLSGMGSTCVLLIVRAAKVYIGHVGDSRIYLIRERRITQLTKDHSFVQMLVDMGEISKEQAEHHPRKNEITNALGLPDMSPATVKETPITPQAGDCFLLCSDGLSGMVNDRTIEKIVSKQRELRTQERADLLVKIANENGGVDNITVELIEFTITPKTPKSGNRMGKLGWIVCLFVLLCVIVYGGIRLSGSETVLESKSWGEIVFKGQQTVFTIEPEREQTVIRFEDSIQRLNHAITDTGQISTNLNCKKSGNTYIVVFGNEMPGNADSVFVQLDFGKQQYRYVLRLKEQKKELPLISLQPRTLAKVAYAKNKPFALLTFVPSDNMVVLSVDNMGKPIEMEGKLDSASVNVESAKKEYFIDAGKEVWRFEFDASMKSNKVIISFICEVTDRRDRYTYEIPVIKSDSDLKAALRKKVIPKINASDTLSDSNNTEILDSLKMETDVRDSLLH